MRSIFPHVVDFKETIPDRLKQWLPERLAKVSLSGQGCSLCLKPGAVKCCQFQPIFYNFHMGELSVEICHDNSWMLPLGMRPKQAVKPYLKFCDFFSESEGSCTIWSNRPPECVSYFCEGDSQLKENFQQLNTVWHQYESTVAQMAMVEMGFDVQSLNEQLDFFDFTKLPIVMLSIEDQKRIWQDYYGQEREFYRSCYNFAKQLDWRAIEEWL